MVLEIVEKIVVLSVQQQPFLQLDLLEEGDVGNVEVVDTAHDASTTHVRAREHINTHKDTDRHTCVCVCACVRVCTCPMCVHVCVHVAAAGKTCLANWQAMSLLACSTHHAKLIDNFSHESDVTSLKTPF